MSDLVRSDHLFRNWRMSEDGQTFIFTDSDGDFPPDWYTSDLGFSGVKRLTDLNPQLKDKTLSHTELISYRDADGRKLYGVLFYPANYEKGRKYPLITEVYERYFDNGFNPTLNIFTSADYAVLHYADRIKTPLLCITGDQDPNVEALQSQEIYYALRRLGKKAVWLRYYKWGSRRTSDQ